MRRSLRVIAIVVAAAATACESDTSIIRPHGLASEGSRLVVGTLPFADGYESTTPGTLSTDYLLVAGAMAVASGGQLDGTPGRILQATGSPPGLVHLLAVTGLDNGRLSFDYSVSGGQHGLAWVRAADPANGYLLKLNVSSVDVLKVVGGSQTTLGSASLGRVGGAQWWHITVELDGSEIRVTDGEGMMLRVTDATYASGDIFLGGFFAAFDNLVIEAAMTADTPAAAATLPFATGFDDLAERSGMLQHPNFDLLGSTAAATYYGPFPQRDGTPGRVLQLGHIGGAPSLLVLAGVTLADGRVGFDHYANGGVLGEVWFRAADPANGYQLTLNHAVANLYRVVGGTRTQIASDALGRSGGAQWWRITVELDGAEIRVTDGEGMVMRVADGAFSSGGIFFGGTAATVFDNLLIEAATTPQVPAAPTTLPFSTGFDDLASRSGMLQHPHLDILGPTGVLSYTYGQVRQRDGTVGRVLYFGNGATPSLLALAGATLTDGRVGIDHYGTGGVVGQLWLRAADPSNGYLLELNHSVANLFRVVGGVRTEIGSDALARSGGAQWWRITVELEGPEIRVTDGEGMMLRVTDGTYSSGQFYLGGWNGTFFDNLLIETVTTPLTTAAAATLPFSTGFDELTDRSGMLQHPNLEMIGPAGAVSYTYGQARQPDGTVGRVAYFGNGATPSLLALAGVVLTDARVEVDHRGTGGPVPQLWLRASDPANGYLLELSNFSARLWRVVGGIKTSLGSAGLTNPAGERWWRITAELVESEIRVSDGEGMLLVATDATYGSGQFFIGGWGGAFFDNLDVEALNTNTPPVARITASATLVTEGSTITFNGGTSSDDDGTVSSYEWSFDGGATFTAPSGNPIAMHDYPQDGNFSVVLRVHDDDGAEDISAPTAIVVTNVAPVVTQILLGSAPIPVGTTVNIAATFTDPGLLDSHTGSISWETATTGGTITEPTPGLAGTLTGSFAFTEAGVYTITVKVSDGLAIGSRSSSLDAPAYVVVYDPDNGFVTGGGWFLSPSAACLSTICGYNGEGKATFGFVAKYHKGASVPSGNAEFDFHAGGLTFKSTSYQWLVVAGAKAKFKGMGRVNGEDGYTFMITAIDGKDASDGAVDRFRIRIWNAGGIVYDNHRGQSEDSDAATQLGGGNIMVHK